MRKYHKITSLLSVLSITLFVSSIFLAGCSASKGKSGQGEGAEHFSDEDLALQQSNYGEGNIPQAQEGGLFADVHFDYNSSAVSPEYRTQLKQAAQTLMADTTLHAEIEGHCDKRGTKDYNMALGATRAKAVAAVLTSSGVNPSQVSTISYGAEIPLDPGSTEEAFAKNRRAHFALYRQGEKGKAIGSSIRDDSRQY